jgi:hypothetical protein
MNTKQILFRLKAILDRSDVESDGLLSRKPSPQHDSEIEVLLEHISLLVLDLRFQAEASKRELFEANRLLEE